MKWVKDFFILLKLSKRKNNKSKKLVPYHQLCNITILSENEEISSLSTQTIIGICEFTINITYIYRENNPAYECYDYSDFNLLGRPKSKIKTILEKPVDLIVVTHNWIDPLTAHFLKMMDGVARIGFYHEDHEKILDLMMEREALPLAQNIEHLIKYYKKLH
ncbi:DUF6913 domain-containing protein [Anditalea andensis]|uniref:Uncharacterized protein n=1 Tax=Anditalea andensis TaxID=1048983 RepID=A0A074KUC8_9BACT|nr:hypothetical protein [Anditalea andensis]KEO72514.1 hypothetical protein EL17_17400 [Anditalea andensis]